MFWKKSKEAPKPSEPAFSSPASTPPAAAPAVAVPAAPSRTENSISRAAASTTMTQQALASALTPALGKLTAVLMFSPRHENMSLKELSQLVLPAVANDMIVIAEARNAAADGGQQASAPVGALLWARVSDEVDRRLAAEPSRVQALKPSEWTGGDNYWLIEAIGAPKVVESMIKELVEGPFKGRLFKMRLLDAEGRAVVQTFDLRSPA